MCSSKKVFLKISQISQENTCIGVSSQKNCRSSGLQFYQKETPTQVFPVKFTKFLRTRILKNICEPLLLQFLSYGSMFIIYVIILSTKNKNANMGVHSFIKIKNKDSWKQKKLFSVNSFQKILIFHICISSESAQCFVRAFF